MDSEKRRLYLRVTVKLMSLALLIGLGYTFLRSLPASPESGNTLSYDLGGLQPGVSVRLQWDNKRVILYKRHLVETDKREKLAAFLLDPQSHHSSQPEFADNPYRSRDPRYFIALDYGTDLNCQLDYVDGTQAGPEEKLWLGGLRDRCRGSWYDDAGRVYQGQQALRNLTIPTYRIEGDTLTLGVE
jgi:ubiquinol-cytochrome c reductase iron-sulfur subunit